MDIPEAVQEMAQSNPGVHIAVPDMSQAFEYEGRVCVAASAIIGHYIVDNFGNVVSFEPSPGYRMVVEEQDLQ